MNVRELDAEEQGYIRLAFHRTPLITFAGWRMVRDCEDGLGAWRHPRLQRNFIHSVAREEDGEVWAHVSLSRFDQRMPTWDQTRDLWRLIYPDILGIIVIPPEDKHVNIAEVAHIWGCLTRPAAPDFTRGTGSI
jgi:hypothetical protein